MRPYPCPNFEACLGSPQCVFQPEHMQPSTATSIFLKYDSLECQTNRTAGETLNNNASLCAEGYTGVLCASCQQGYGRFQHGCTPCPSQDTSAIAAIAVTFFLLGTAAIFALHEGSLDPKDSLGPPISLGIDWLQTLGCLSLFSIVWSSESSSVLNVASGANLGLSFLELNCVTRLDYFQTLVASCTGIFILTASLMLVIVLKRCINGYRFKKRKPFQQIGEEFATAALVIINLAHMPMARASLEFFNCNKDIDEVGPRLKADFGIQCYGDAWNAYLPVAVFGLILTVAIPIAMSTVLMVVARYDAKQLLITIEGQGRLYRIAGFMYVPFIKPAKKVTNMDHIQDDVKRQIANKIAHSNLKQIAWMQMQMLRRSVVVVFVLLPSTNEVRMFGLLLWIGCHMLLMVAMKPYRQPIVNYLELSCQGSVFVTLVFGKLDEANTTSSGPAKQGWSAFTVLIVIVNISCAIVVIVALIMLAIEKYENKKKKSQNKRHLTTQILCIAKTGQLVHELEILRKRSSLFNLGVSVSEQAEDSVSQGSGEGIEMQTTSKATKAPSEPFDDSWLPPPPEKTSSWKLASNAVRAPIRMKRSSEANAKWKAEGLKAASQLLVDLDDMIATAESDSQQGSQAVRAGKAPLEPSHLAADQPEPPDGWSVIQDEEGETYFWEEASGRTTRDNPSCAASSAGKEMLQLPLFGETPSDAGRAPAELKQATNRRRQFSVEHTEEGDAYFVDNATLETTWDLPADASVVDS